MQKSAQKNTENQEINPLEALSDLLQSDMRHVNTIITDNMQSEVPLIPKLAEYIISAGGKRIRPLLTLASTAVFDGNMKQAHLLAAAVEFIHTATLLHDDVVDESNERRGKKTANLIFGNQASVLVGDFLFSKAFQMMVKSNSIEILGILSNASAVIAQGEVLQLATTNDINTKLPAYLDVIESKTAALFEASCEVGAVISNRPEQDVISLKEYGMKIGTAFQIIDDALDYSAHQQTLGKEIGDDFREGKMTAPVIFAIENANAEEMQFWKQTLGYKKQNKGDFERALTLIKNHNALNKSIDLAAQYVKEAQNALSTLPQNTYTSLLHDLADYTIDRKF